MAPPPNQTRAKALADFRRLMRWMGVLAVVMIGLALLTFRFMDVPITITMVIATIAGDASGSPSDASVRASICPPPDAPRRRSADAWASPSAVRALAASRRPA